MFALLLLEVLVTILSLWAASRHAKEPLSGVTSTWPVVMYCLNKSLKLYRLSIQVKMTPTTHIKYSRVLKTWQMLSTET